MGISSGFSGLLWHLPGPLTAVPKNLGQKSFKKGSLITFVVDILALLGYSSDVLRFSTTRGVYFYAF